MKKVKYIKFEQQDGTFTDNIPLAMNIDQVDMSSMGDKSLQTILDENEAAIQANVQTSNAVAATQDRLNAKEDENYTLLNTMVDNLEDQSPKGYYATTSAVTTANPATGVYLVTADNHLYTWFKNSSAPTDLGLYRAEPDEKLQEKLNAEMAAQDAQNEVEETTIEPAANEEEEDSIEE